MNNSTFFIPNIHAHFELLQCKKIRCDMANNTNSNVDLKKFIYDSVVAETRWLCTTIQSQIQVEGDSIKSAQNNSLDKLCQESAERICQHILQKVQLEYTKENLAVLFDYEKHCLELLKDYKEEIKFSTNILEDIRKERANFFAETLKEVSNTLKETQVDDSITSKWIQNLVNSYTDSLNVSNDLAEESVVAQLGELRAKAKSVANNEAE